MNSTEDDANHDDEFSAMMNGSGRHLRAQELLVNFSSLFLVFDGSWTVGLLLQCDDE